MEINKIEEVEIGKLIPYVNNQKIHTPEQIEKIAGSIKEFGFLNPIIVDRDNVIIAGHGRYEGAKKLRLEKVPVLRAEHLTPAQVKAYRIADNRLAELTTWDNELLAVDLSELETINFDMDVLGFDEKELNEILDGFNVENTDYEKADEVPEVEETPVIKRGDLIELGKEFQHRVLCGDSTSDEDVKRLMNGEKADIVFTDPDYAMDNDNWIDNLQKYGIKENYPVFIMATDKQQVRYVNKIQNFRKFFVGVKNVAYMINNSMPMSKFTLVSFFGKTPSKFFNNLKDYFTDVFEYKKNVKENEKKEGHRHYKSVEVPELFISHYSKKNNLVLDLFLGSGSTLIASENLKRICYGMELEEKYCQLIVERYVTYTSNPQIKINGKIVDWNEYKENNQGGI